VGQELKLEEFRVLYKNLKRGILWWDHLVLGLLVWLETTVIERRVVQEVDKAIKDYEKVEPSLPDYITPIYSEKPSEASVSLPEMRLTAPWYKESND